MGFLGGISSLSIPNALLSLSILPSPCRLGIGRLGLPFLPTFIRHLVPYITHTYILIYIYIYTRLRFLRFDAAFRCSPAHSVHNERFLAALIRLLVVPYLHKSYLHKVHTRVYLVQYLRVCFVGVQVPCNLTTPLSSVRLFAKVFVVEYKRGQIGPRDSECQASTTRLSHTRLTQDVEPLRTGQPSHVHRC